MVFSLYKFFVTFLSPIIQIGLFWKTKNLLDPAGNHNLIREKYYKERRGISTTLAPAEPVIWFHMVSAGETLSVIPLLKELIKLYPNTPFLLTTTTVAGHYLLETHLKNESAHWFHHYVPLDVPAWTNRFLNHWNPKAAFFVESELWPTVLSQLNERNIPTILLNARISKRSFKRWKKYPRLVTKILKDFRLILPQSFETKEHLEHLLPAAYHHFISYIGNLKFTASDLPVDGIKLKELKQMCGKRPVWIAASTHPSEEVLIGQVHKILQETFLDLLTIIVPRHPKRAEEIRTDLENKGLSCALRSQGEKTALSTQIYIADTFGELGLFYSLNAPVFMGGTFVPIGGHNPLEPASFKCPLLWGPHMFNFKDVADLLKGSIIEVNNLDELAHELKSILGESKEVQNKRMQLGQAVYDKCNAEKAHIMSSTLEKIRAYID